MNPDVTDVFTVGLTISLEFDEGEVSQFSLSRVEEAEDDHLWVAMPTHGGMFVPLPVATQVMVHAKRGDVLYALRTRVVGRRLQPTPMLHLGAVSDIQQRQAREYVRLRIVLIPSYAAVIDDEGGETRFATTILNLGAGGALFRSRQALQIGQQVRFAVDLPAPGGSIGATGRVLHVDARRAERGVYHDAGVAFLDLSEHDRDLITKFIFRFQLRHRQESGTPA